MEILLPPIIDAALAQKHESVNDACAWVWFHSTHERSLVDLFLVTTQHPLAYQAGSPFERFKALVKELRADNH